MEKARNNYSPNQQKENRHSGGGTTIHMSTVSSRGDQPACDTDPDAQMRARALTLGLSPDCGRV